MKTIQISDEMYDTLQRLKEVFYEMGEGERKGNNPFDTFSDEDVLSILVGGFIDSLGESVTDKDEEQENI